MNNDKLLQINDLHTYFHTEDGLVKAACGDTTIAEVRRMLPRLAQPRSLAELRRLTGYKR